MMTNESALRLLVRSLLRESAGSSLLPPGVDHDFFVAWYRRCGSHRFSVNVPNVIKRLISVGFSPEEATELANLAADCLDPSHPVPKTTRSTAGSTISRALRLGAAPLALIKKTIYQEDFGTFKAYDFVEIFKWEEPNLAEPTNAPIGDWIPPKEDVIYNGVRRRLAQGFVGFSREDLEREMDFVESVSAFEEPKQVPVRNLRRLLVQGIDGIMQAAQIYRDL